MLPRGLGDGTGYRRGDMNEPADRDASAGADADSPWARADSDFRVGSAHDHAASRAGGSAHVAGSDSSAPAWPQTGAVTATWFSDPPGQEPADPPYPQKWRKPGTIGMFAWGAGLLLVIGLVIVLVMALAGAFGGGRSSASGSGLFGGGQPETDPNAPPLAKLCPPPTNAKPPEYAEPPPPPPGARTVDRKAGISYASYGAPWKAWNEDWSGGDLKVHYRVGQHFITEEYSGGTYHASILSGSVPATVNDGTALDLKCTGKQVTADVRTSYYPEPNRMKQLRGEETKLGGRPAWVSIFRLHFDEPGLKAKNELVGVALIDVGRTEAAVLYVSIPGTHKQHDDVVEDVITSVRPVA